MDSVPRYCFVIAALVLAPAGPRAADLGWADDPSRARHGLGLERESLTVRERGVHHRPYRPLAGASGYVGSDYGLGKPAVTGLGTRPDWGRSYVD